MKIRLLKPWNGQPVGYIMEPTIKDVGTQLIRRGIAELVEEKPEKRKPKLQEWVKGGPNVQDH